MHVGEMAVVNGEVAERELRALAVGTSVYMHVQPFWAKKISLSLSQLVCVHDVHSLLGEWLNVSLSPQERSKIYPEGFDG